MTLPAGCAGLGGSPTSHDQTVSGSSRRRVVVVGGGHNGLVAACYLGLAGHPVLVLEALERPGGGSRTEETVPGHRFDLHSVAHNLINMTSIPTDLRLGEAGLTYLEMDPFAVGVFADGRRVRFHRSVAATLESIAEVSLEDVAPYRDFVKLGDRVLKAILPSIRGTRALPALASLLGTGRQLGRVGIQELARDTLGSYEDLLHRRLFSDLTRGPLAAFAAHGSVGPTVAGGALFAFWQAAYHRFGQWHAQGGSQGLIDALTSRLAQLGGELRCSAPVDRIEAANGAVTGLVLEDGARIPTELVVAAVDPQLALLGLLNPPLGGAAGRELASVHRSNVVQGVVHVAVDRLPPYPNAKLGDWNGLQSFVDHLDDLRAAWYQAEMGELPRPLPLYAFTTSALDSGLAPEGRHTVYLACPTTPFEVRGGWAARREEFVDAALSELAARAPGLRAGISRVSFRTPEEMALGGRWPGGHPMHLDLTLDQLGPMRPTPTLSSHRSGIRGLYVCGAGTKPSGGILGTPGRLAARALLQDLRSSRGSAHA
ncbi:MAG: phytoene desaturase family protein [Acidimicrobiales bacterium]